MNIASAYRDHFHEKNDVNAMFLPVVTCLLQNLRTFLFIQRVLFHLQPFDFSSLEAKYST
jgi:hypothetical protein